MTTYTLKVKVAKMASRRKHQSLVRCFEVTDPTLHDKGHTIYKVTQKIINVEKPDEEMQEFVAWRRFNDFKKLYKAMHQLHSALQRKEEFPPFSQPKMFGRFEHSVIKERMHSAQDLLNFLGQRHYLVANKAFQQFFQGAVKVEKGSSEFSLLQPDCESSQLSLPSDFVSDDDTASESTNHLSLPPDNGASRSSSPELGGVWKYRQVPDEISLGDGDSDSQTDTDFTDDSSVQGTPIPESEAAFFDPMKSEDDRGRMVNVPATDGMETGVSNEWLLSQMAVLETEVEGSVDEDAGEDGYLRVGVAPGGQSMEVEMSGPDPEVLRDLLDSGECENLPKSDNQYGSPSFDPSPSLHSKVDLALDPSKAPAASFQKKGTPVSSPVRGIVSLDMRGGRGDYIIMAANQISLAQQCEVNANYQMAFSYYKAGVGILLTGVQKDDNSTRREVVRRKTARYLMKAEELFHSHLASPSLKSSSSVNCRWDTGQPSPAKRLDPNVAFLQGPVSEMGNYKVLGIINKVLLVMDSLTEGTFVLKVLQKTCTPQDLRRSVVPSHIPFMVRLYKFYETDSAIFLLLQHAPGGQLWNYVSAYLNQHHELEINGVLDDPKERKLRICSDNMDNLYLGRAEPLTPAEGQVQSTKNGAEAVKCANRSSHRGNSGRADSTCKRRPSSLGFDETQDSFPLYNGQCDIEPNVTNFEEILKSTQVVSGNFSIESADSDSEGGSRFHSTASMDHTVEVIPEVNEDLSTPNTRGHVDEVFSAPVSAIAGFDDTDDLVGNELGAYSETDVKSLDTELNDLDLIAVQAIATHSKSQVINSTASSNKAVSPNMEAQATRGCSKIPSSLGRPEDKSIYDVYQDNNSNSTSSSKIGSPASVPVTPTSDQRRSRSCSKSSIHMSQHSAGDDGTKSRSRTLSDVFGELDLAGSESMTGQGRPIVRLPEGCVCQWAAEMVTAISSLHSLGIVCRDLHPGNILLGERGHVMLTYFSWWNCVDWEPCQHALNDLYTAPEVRGVYEVGPACDWWSLGSLLYELLTGKSLVSCHPGGITSHTQVAIPDDLSPEAQSILQELLRPSPSERLGSGLGGVDDIRSHPFFSSVSWPSLMSQQG